MERIANSWEGEGRIPLGSRERRRRNLERFVLRKKSYKRKRLPGGRFYKRFSNGRSRTVVGKREDRSILNTNGRLVSLSQKCTKGTTKENPLTTHHNSNIEKGNAVLGKIFRFRESAKPKGKRGGETFHFSWNDSSKERHRAGVSEKTDTNNSWKEGFHL